MFSSTAHLEDEWSFMNVIFNDDELDDKLQKLFDYQEKNIKKKQAVLIVLDDVNMLNNTRSKLLTKVYSLGRHLFLTIIVSVQYPKYILNGLIRNNIDYLFFSELNQTTLESMYECINTELDKREFYKFIRENTRDNQFVFYNLHDDDNKLKVVKAEFLKLEQKGKKKLKIKL
ncbi:hypothetical protein ABPG74_005749 [Tetrahymena malaccensis]